MQIYKNIVYVLLCCMLIVFSQDIYYNDQVWRRSHRVGGSGGISMCELYALFLDRIEVLSRKISTLNLNYVHFIAFSVR